VSVELVKDRSYKPYPALDAAGYGRAVQRILDLYDWNVTQVQMNLLDSHDTARFLSIARGDKASVRLGMLLLMTYPGAPSVYYGDEICIRGSDNTEALLNDSDARWAFPWDQPESWDKEMLAYFKAVIGLRHEYAALRRGAYRELYAEGDVYVFTRQFEGETVLVGVNVGTEAQTVEVSIGDLVEEDAKLEQVFGDGEADLEGGGQVKVSIGARDGVVYLL
jgi:glycosidase